MPKKNKRSRVKRSGSAPRKANPNGSTVHTLTRGRRKKTSQTSDRKMAEKLTRRPVQKPPVTSSLQELFEKILQEIYSAEKQILEALPELKKASFSAELQRTFQLHTHHTRKHIERLERIFEKIKTAGRSQPCPPVEGLIKECHRIVRESEPGAVRDAELIISAQQIEHYEISVYGSLFELAEVLGHFRIADIIDRSLAEEESTDHHLTQIAKNVNDEAMQMNKNSMKYERISLN
jgi:ferritin-like metal-binding protein YciE